MDSATILMMSRTHTTLKGANGVVIDDAKRSGITDSHVYDVGCIGVTLSGGNITTLEPGLNWAVGNRIHHMANYKRTYQPGLHWSGTVLFPL
jgi:hypothetical protein